MTIFQPIWPSLAESTDGSSDPEWTQMMRTRPGLAIGVGWYIRVSCGGDEVKAAVDTSVRDAFLPGDVHLLLQELLVLLIDVLLNGLPADGGESR